MHLIIINPLEANINNILEQIKWQHNVNKLTGFTKAKINLEEWYYFAFLKIFFHVSFNTRQLDFSTSGINLLW